MLWVKMLHVLATFLWIAGLMVTSRVAVLHVGETVDVQRRFAELERRIMRFATMPGLLLTWAFGIWMLVDRPWLLDAKVAGPVFHIKLTLVVLLTGLTHMLQAKLRRLAEDPGTHHARKPFLVVHHASAVMLVGILWALYVQGGR